MKNILIVFTLLAGFALVGCEDFLDTKNLTKKDTMSYPATQAELEELLTGTYRTAREAEIAPEYVHGGFLMSEIMSDDRFGSAGSTSSNDTDVSDFERFFNKQENFFEQAWNQSYATIFRANSTIEAIGRLTWTEEQKTERDYIHAQALFLRAYMFFYLARMFGTAPMPMTPEPLDLPRASEDDLFGRIAADLLTAITLMPDEQLAPQPGRATRWAAKSILARAFMFYTGVYNKTSIKLANEEGQEQENFLTKEQVIGHLEDVINHSGHDLVPNFYTLWPYTNTLTRENGGYRWLDSVDPQQELAWVGEDNNKETVFAWRFGTSGTNDTNRAVLFMGIRLMDYSGTHDRQTERTFPFGSGWGFGTVNPKLWAEWPDNDIRKKGSILDMSDPLETNNYQPGADFWMQETGYMQKKYMPILYEDVKNANGNGVPARQNITYGMYPTTTSSGDYQNNNSQDYVVIRFADVLLMAAELLGPGAGDQYLNRVRTRVGLGAAPGGATLENIQKERRYELAFEGIRWFDMLRWGLDYTIEHLNAQNGATITNSTDGQPGSVTVSTINFGDQSGRVNATRGFFPIPLQEINKSSNPDFQQTPGW